MNPEGGPGTYHEHRNFDDNARVHEFGQRREEKLDSNPGPGSYEHHVTKEMANNTNPKWIWQNITGRKDTIIGVEGGPGTYEEHRKFGDNAKVHEFGQRREERSPDGPGPGHYDDHTIHEM